MNWQDWAAILAVGTASLFIARRFYLSMTARAGGGCGHDCGGRSKSDFGIRREQIIPLGELKHDSHQGAK